MIDNKYEVYNTVVAKTLSTTKKKCFNSTLADCKNIESANPTKIKLGTES
jgi:hypothetical protein